MWEGDADGGPMGTIILTCASTGQEFSAGVEMDRYTFDSLQDDGLVAHCPHCNAPHRWRPGNARFVDAVPPSMWAENGAKGYRKG
jgi:hypothetical protein